MTFIVATHATRDGEIQTHDYVDRKLVASHDSLLAAFKDYAERVSMVARGGTFCIDTQPDGGQSAVFNWPNGDVVSIEMFPRE